MFAPSINVDFSKLAAEEEVPEVTREPKRARPASRKTSPKPEKAD